ncbi:TnsA-like heteromeric transposase endonuclease subunit [Streptomyces sp. NPDC041003]|uniref:TnsA-like heteromeric transposase endonuclease subunit n=1 Tax=Streptomyces sp. NPDC041003 TaxID=3155730 RepID=UPI0033C1C952
MDSPAITVSVRINDGTVIEDLPWTTVSIDLLRAATPWRKFRWRHGQRHHPGSYWSSTMGDHVPYESQLELSRLLFADFDPLVQSIVAQPFLLKAALKGRICRHTPDFLLITSRGPMVVDVKPSRQLGRPEVVFAFGWTGRAVEGRGWRYEVWSEPAETELANLRFLAGYRRGRLFPSGVLDELRQADLDGIALGDAVRSLPHLPTPFVRAAVYHLLWTHELLTDLGRPLASSVLLRRPT